jgi:hypothetical protein
LGIFAPITFQYHVLKMYYDRDEAVLEEVRVHYVDGLICLLWNHTVKISIQVIGAKIPNWKRLCDHRDSINNFTLHSNTNTYIYHNVHDEFLK